MSVTITVNNPETDLDVEPYLGIYPGSFIRIKQTGVYAMVLKVRDHPGDDMDEAGFDIILIGPKQKVQAAGYMVDRLKRIYKHKPKHIYYQ